MLDKQETLEEYFIRMVGTQPKFEPKLLFDSDGNSVEYYAKSDESYTERIDNVLSVYRSFKDDTIVGCRIILGTKRD